MPRVQTEPLSPTDITTTRTLLHEAIPLTGAILSGTYTEGGGGSPFYGSNVKNYTHGQFQSVYDYPYLSSSANHIMDLTFGYDESSTSSGSTSVLNAKKINNYNLMSQVLLGYTGSENITEIFESDLNYADNNNQMKECFFFNFSRLITKDEIRPGNFSLTLGTGSYAAPWGAGGADIGKYFPLGPLLKLQDFSASAASNTGLMDTVGGKAGVLYISGTNGATGIGGTGSYAGLVFYQAGIAVLTASLFTNVTDMLPTSLTDGGGNQNVKALMTGSSISGACDAIRHRIYDLSFNNTTAINSQIIFCRAPHNKFNYSANPTYLSGSKVRVKNISSDSPRAYITTVGLYSSDNQLMAVAKLSEPLMKDPSNELTIRVRLDY